MSFEIPGNRFTRPVRGWSSPTSRVSLPPLHPKTGPVRVVRGGETGLGFRNPRHSLSHGVEYLGCLQACGAASEQRVSRCVPASNHNIKPGTISSVKCGLAQRGARLANGRIMFQGRERRRVVSNFAFVTGWSPTLKWTLAILAPFHDRVASREHLDR